MRIELLKDITGAKRFGTCVECGIGSFECKALRRITFNQRSSICLCPSCLNQLSERIFFIEEHAGKHFYNGRVVCVRETDNFIKGRIYDVIEGQVINDKGKISTNRQTKEDFYKYYKDLFIELVE